MAIPDFSPRIHDEIGMGMFYEDGRVSASVDEYRNGCVRTLVISEWSSSFPGNGHTIEALEWIRAQGFSQIVAQSVGLIEDGVGDISTAYWQHIHALGLVDVLFDDNHQNITPTRNPGGKPR